MNDLPSKPQPSPPPAQLIEQALVEEVTTPKLLRRVEDERCKAENCRNERKRQSAGQFE